MNDLVDRLRFVFSVSSGAPTLLTEAADEIERLRKDAERYRWLRDAKTDWSDARIVMLYAGPDFDRMAGDELDAAIDAALQAKEQG